MSRVIITTIIALFIACCGALAIRFGIGLLNIELPVLGWIAIILGAVWLLEALVFPQYSRRIFANTKHRYFRVI